MFRIKAWIFTPQMVICYVLLVSVLAFVVPKGNDEPEVQYNDIPINSFRAKEVLLGTSGEFYPLNNVIHIIEVEMGHKPGDVVEANNHTGYYKLIEEIGEGGDILHEPMSLIEPIYKDYYYGEILYPDMVHDDTLVVVKPKLLKRLLMQSDMTDGAIMRALRLTTRRY